MKHLIENDSYMRELGFTDHREGFWYKSWMLDRDVSLGFTINKATHDWEEDVLNIMFGQPEYYNRRMPKWRDEMIAKIDAIVKELNDLGFPIHVDHEQYGEAQNDYLGSLDPDELQAEQEFLDNHWANDLLDAPHALIAVIETKIARAVLAERERIIKLFSEHYERFDVSNNGVDEMSKQEFIELVKTEAQDD